MRNHKAVSTVFKLVEVGPFACQSRCGRKSGALFSAIFALFFFLPYLPGGRLRFDLLLCYGSALYLLISPRQISSAAIRPLQGLISLSFICVIITAMFMILPDMDIFFKAIIVTNYNFMFFSLCVFIVFHRFLLRSRDKVVVVLLIASLAINAIAISQWLDPTSSFNKIIYSLFGGAPPEEAIRLGYETFGEFLAVAAHRCTSIFNGMHTLAMFDLVIISIGINYLILPILYSDRLRLFALCSVCMAFAGGAISFSKTFLLGVMLLLAMQLILSGKMRLLIRFMSVFMVILAVFAAFVYYAGIEEELMAYITQDTLATRYGEGAYLAKELAVIETDVGFLLFGAGVDLGSYKIADSLYISAIVVGGVTYLSVYLLPYLFLIKKNYREHLSGNPWARCFLAIHATFLAIGIGIPTYQVGRIVPLLIILNLCFLVQCAQPLSNRSAVT